MLVHRSFLTSLLLIGPLGCKQNVPEPSPVPPPQPKITETRPDVAPAMTPAKTFGYPDTPSTTESDLLHGVAVSDPFRWLEDTSRDPVKQWMKEQDAFTRNWLEKLPSRAQLRARFTELFYVDSRGAPVREGNRYFYWEKPGKSEKAIVYWQEGKNGKPKALLDPNVWSSDGSVSLGSWSVGPNGRLVAYQVKKNAADEAVIEFIEVATGRKLEKETLEGGRYADVAWSPRGDIAYYSWVPPLGSVPTPDRPGHVEIRAHVMGKDPSSDQTIRGKTGDPKTFNDVFASEDRRFLFHLVRHGWVSADVWFLDQFAKNPTWTPLRVGEEALYRPFSFKNQLFVLTNEGAPRYRLFAVDPRKPERAAWTEIVPEHQEMVLDHATIVGGKLALTYLHNVQSYIELRDPDGRHPLPLDLPGIGTASITGRADDAEATLQFESFLTPSQLYSFDTKTRKRSLIHEVKVPFDPSPYVTEQIVATSKDGTRVPAFVVRAKTSKLTGEAPTLLWGYGGFNVGRKPAFLSVIVPWIEKGGIYVSANIRGGDEFGETWHQQGMRRKKQNVFDDFIAIGEELIRRKYTSPQKLAIRGGSNGGLLVGAVMTQRPDLFRAVLCDVPLLDMVRYHQFGSGKTWINEYGSAEDPDDFKAIYAYSPYHHVQAGVRYPSILIGSADSDDRVDPLHARKFAALLQTRSAGGPALLRIERNSGHGGADRVESAVLQRADQYAFLFHELGIE